MRSTSSRSKTPSQQVRGPWTEIQEVREATSKFPQGARFFSQNFKKSTGEEAGGESSTVLAPWLYLALCGNCGKQVVPCLFKQTARFLRERERKPIIPRVREPCHSGEQATWTAGHTADCGERGTQPS